MQIAETPTKTRLLSNLYRILKYTFVRAVVLFMTVAIAVYLTIVIANFGGHIDEFIKGELDYAIGMSMKGMQGVTAEEKAEIFEQRKAAAYEAAGLNTPFFIRCARWLGRGLTLDWGETNLSLRSNWFSSGSRPIRSVILESLPRSLLIFGSSNVLLFFTTMLIALTLTKRNGSWLDQIIIALSPLSSVPAWAYGIVLNVVAIRTVGGAFAGGTFDAWPNEFKLVYLPVILKHLVLPLLAIFLSGFFQGIYTWRALFQLHAREDFVELAGAKGLPHRLLARRYILRPILPTLMTSFALIFVNLWQEVIVLEQFFNVAGVGRLFVQAVQYNRTPFIVALVVTFAYLLAITVFVLDILYAIVDPRIKIESQARTVRAKIRTQTRRLWPIQKKSIAKKFECANAQEAAPISGTQSSRTPLGLEALHRIFDGLQVEKRYAIDWLTTSGTQCELVADRFYPEVCLAFCFKPNTENVDRLMNKRCRNTGIVVITMTPNQPIQPETLREIRTALSSAARRIAQRPGARDVKRALMPRIAKAKAVAERMFERQDSELRTERSHAAPSSAAPTWKERLVRLRDALKLTTRRLAGYPFAVIGLLIILSLIGTSIYTVITIPYEEMIARWREGEETWTYNPQDAPPAWINLFRKDKLPNTIVLDSRDPTMRTGNAPTKVREAVSEDMTRISLTFPFEYTYGAFPQDLGVFIDAKYEDKRPLITLNWLTPDGREIEVMSTSIKAPSYVYRISQDSKLERKLDSQSPWDLLLTEPGSTSSTPLNGPYRLQLNAYVFEESADVDAKFVLYGQVFGLAGTDERRRDLTVPLLWGMPVALAFGLLAAASTSVTSVLIAGVGTWYDGWIDTLVQRITEVNMILPFLPVSIMVYKLYSKSFWMILGVTVLLSIFGSSIKRYRAIFLQVREAPYVEAAQSYGASNWRIISRYLIPRIVSVLVPQLVIMVPSYVFLEASLAFLGVSDPVLPTWGKLLVTGFARGLYNQNYHLILEPLGLLLLVGFAFAMLGVSLERLFNAKIRPR